MDEVEEGRIEPRSVTQAGADAWVRGLALFAIGALLRASADATAIRPFPASYVRDPTLPRDGGQCLVQRVSGHRQITTAEIHSRVNDQTLTHAMAKLCGQTRHNPQTEWPAITCAEGVGFHASQCKRIAEVIDVVVFYGKVHAKPFRDCW